MKKLVMVILVLMCFTLQAKENWINLFATEKINEIEETDGAYYFATDGGLLIYDKQTWELERHFTIENGLPSQKIEDIAVDNEGKVWIGTYDNGVAMRQGSKWIHIETPNYESSHNSKLYCLEFDRFNNLWIGTDAGLFKYVDGVWENVIVAVEDNFVDHTPVWDMQRDRNGDVYMASFWPMKLEDAEFKVYDEGSAFSYGDACIKYYDDKIYFGNKTGSFFTFDGDNWTHDFYFPTSSEVADIEVMDNGNIWASSINGDVCKFSNGVLTNVIQNQAGISNTQLHKSKNGDLLIAVDDKVYISNGISVDVNEVFLEVTTQIPNADLKIGINENNQILMMSDDRLFRFNENDFETQELDPLTGREDYAELMAVNFPDNTVGFFEPATGNLYYDNQTISIFNPNNVLPLDFLIYDFLVDSEGGYWVASRQGLLYNNGTTTILFNQNNSPFPITHYELGGPSFLKVTEDRNKNIWVSGLEGVGMWNRVTNNWTFYSDSETNSMTNDLSTFLYFDEQNILWASGEVTGLVRFDGKNWTRFTENNSSLPSNYVEDIYPYENMLIIATGRGGISFFDGTEFKTYTTQNSGLASNYCKSIEQDMRGNIWITHQKHGFMQYGGISIFNPKGINFIENDLPQLSTPNISYIALNEGQFLEMNVYPNPANKFINIDFGQFQQKVNNVQLMDVQGEIYFSKEIAKSEEKLKIYTGDLTAGVYFLEANVGNQIKSRKIIIQ